ncbi:DUF4489 domain-containing protein [Clostridium sp. CM028]|uniref:DUF4489 domain-containing protein n=1 Tax=unclassified Clostridium TaxID=2614128 RepID=UPI001C0BE386|nr:MULTISPECIES: DUF4489 domain-containing protein [unclassified Clostridium]MBU3092701.1 DUF4489 domain-containing protein [Clostridium sp. CF011]MBW9149463.1 DUF4489 domain-containing protein [Clostridium sp. CM028]WAG70533.1 DUF4489 domain-containing protein [Clostridium sp. CF011]WLC62183.1 DUF4489 domain-containing protein [Clostridium sp. CM028]
MNSMSCHCKSEKEDCFKRERENEECCKRDRDREKEECCKRDRDRDRENEAEILLKCKPGTAASVAAATDDEVTKRLATLSINTERFCNPCFKFEFSTNIFSTLPKADDEGNDKKMASVTVRFQLFKLCKRDRVATEVGPEWIFDLSNPSDDFQLMKHDIVTFIVCDCDCDCDCDSECCTYFVQSTTTGTPGDDRKPASITFNNPTLSVLVAENKRHCC